MKQWLPGMLALCLLPAAPAAGQNQPKYLDLYVVKVKPDKRADFEAIGRKIADANRRYKGDHWIAFDTFYGDGSMAAFASPRMDYAEVDKGYKDFEQALKEALGPNASKTEHDFNACLEGARSELRAFRWDLSRNVPKEPEEFHRMMGNMRWMRNTTIEIRRDHGEEFEKLFTGVVDVYGKEYPDRAIMVTQSMLGEEGSRYYMSMPLKGLADLDTIKPLREMLGEENYRKFLQQDSEHVLAVTFTVSRVVPELSNAPDGIVNVSKDFWTPTQPPMVAARKVKTKKNQPPEP